LYVGILATSIDYSLYSALVYYGVFSYAMATVTGYATGFAFSFLLTRNYVFSDVKIDNFYYEFLAVGTITGIGLFLNLSIVFALVQYSFNEYVARAVAIGIVFFFNYFARKRYVYE